MSAKTVPAIGPATQPPSFGWRNGLLLAGDALAFVGFAAAGGNSHREGLDVGQTLAVAAPFFAGWLAI